jgi:hypothetical protein
MNIYDFAEIIETKQDFDRFLIMLHKENLSKDIDWENKNLEHYLEAFSAYSEAIGIDKIPSWKLFAEMLLAAIVYE